MLEPTLTAPDSSASIPLSAAQELFHESLPAQIQDAIAADELASQVVVYPEDGRQRGGAWPPRSRTGSTT